MWVAAASLKRNFDHGVRRQREIHVVQLLATGCANGQGHTQVIARFAGTHFQSGGIVFRVKLLGDLNHGFCKTINPGAHDFDGKAAGVLNERLFAGVGLGGRAGGCAHNMGWTERVKPKIGLKDLAPNYHSANGQPTQ
jgi:hypothetical protein